MEPCGALGAVRGVEVVRNRQGRVALSFAPLLERGCEFRIAVPLFPGMLLLVSVLTLKLPS